MFISLPLKQRVPIGEYAEEFLKERNQWDDFRAFKRRRSFSDEILALEVFLREKDLQDDFYSFRDEKLVLARLDDDVPGA